MANEPISQLNGGVGLTTPAAGDLLPITDVSDTTEAPTGTTKFIAVSDLVTGGVVPDDSVTNAKLANMAQATIKGRASGAGTGDPTDLTGTQATAILDNVVGDSGSGGTKGLVPAPGAGDAAAGKFLKADGTFAVPAGTGAETGANSDITSMDGLTGALENPTQIIFPEAAAPSTPGAGKVTIYAKTDGLVYGKDDAGTETKLSNDASSGAPADATYITQTANGSLSNEQALGSLATGIIKSTTTTGVVSIANVDDISSPVFASDAGANDTYTATLSPAPSAYVTGVHYRFKANTANTGACTINFNGLGAKAIKKAAGGITTDLADNDIRAGQWIDLVYDGTNMQMQSTLGNAAGVSYPLLAPDGTSAAPSYSFTNGTDCGLYFVNGTPDHLKISVGNKEFLDMYQTSSKPILLMTTNLETKIGFGNGSIRAGLMDGGKGSVKFISDESGTPGCGYSATADLVDVAGTRRPWHTAGQVFRHVLTGNRTIGPVAADGGSNSISGIIITIILVQDATGGRTVSWDSSYKWVGGSAPTMTAAANAVDIYQFWCDGSNQAWELKRNQDVK